MGNMSSASKRGNLCSFCRPRVLDLSKLGWKEKTDTQGNTFLEPETSTTSDGEIALKPWKDENAFGTYHDFPDRYGPLGQNKTVKGIRVSGRDITVEYFRNDTLPDCPRLEASNEAGCRFCGMLRSFLRSDYDFWHKYCGNTCYLWRCDTTSNSRWIWGRGILKAALVCD